MPKISDKNPFPGVNPILNSFLQQKSGWKGFHGRYLTHIAEQLEPLLPDGYYTASEESLQLGMYDVLLDSPIGSAQQTIPDITMYRTGESESGQEYGMYTSNPTLTLDLPQTMLEEEVFVPSVVIYKTEPGDFPGTPITRIELLSPANKPPGSHYPAYREKRAQTLHSGLRLVEIDLLHERRSLFDQLPSYPARDEGAFPYLIAVSDPRPNINEDKARIYAFGVMDKLPVIDVPLDGKDTVRVDFGTAYHTTFERSRLFQQLADYEKPPVNVEAYTPADQKRIQEHLTTL